MKNLLEEETQKLVAALSSIPVAESKAQREQFAEQGITCADRCSLNGEVAAAIDEVLEKHGGAHINCAYCGEKLSKSPFAFYSITNPRLDLSAGLTHEEYHMLVEHSVVPGGTDRLYMVLEIPISRPLKGALGMFNGAGKKARTKPPMYTPK